MVRKERIDQRTIRLQQRAGAIPNVIEVVERNYPKPLRWMHWASVSEVDKLPHPLHQLRLRQYPSTTDAAQPVRLCQTASSNEVWPKVKCRTPWLVEQGLEIDLVHQDVRADFGRHLAHLLHCGFVAESTARIVQVAENYEAHGRRESAFQFLQSQPETLIRATFEAANLRSQVIEDGQQRVVGGLLNQHLISPMHEGCERNIVCHRSAERIDNAILGHAGFHRQAFH